MHRISPFALLGETLRTLRAVWLPALSTMLFFQVLTLLIASPLIGWLFREAMRANGMIALDLSSVTFTGGIGITFGLIVVILLLAFWLASLQFVVLLLMLRRAAEKQRITGRGILADLRRVTAKLLRPSSIPLFCYLFFVLPLSGFGFASALSQGIAVPSFISGELMKSPVGAATWVCFLLLIALLNLRFALSLPILVFTDATGGRAMRLSWRLTAGWASVRLAVAGGVILVGAAVATLLLIAIAILPTALTDEVLPAASPAIAAFSLGIAQTLSLALTSLVVVVFGAMLLALVRQREDLLPAGLRIAELADDQHPASAAKRRALPILVSVSAVVALGLGILHLGTMQQLSLHPETLVLGHRGFSDGGAENTIGGLEAADAADADLVEIDVMQTGDGRFVVMHDSELSRLTGQALAVKDLTLDELTGMTVRDQYGHEGRIPSLEEYIGRAKELGMPLLIEIKIGGAETPDHVDLLVQELEELGGMEGNIFHSLDGPSVERLKEIRPDATIGYILAFAGLGVPDTPADFLVIEEWSATQEMQDAAAQAGLGFFSWTVNDEAGMRELLRRDADGIITDHPDQALAARSEMQEEQGLAGVLLDALTRFVVVF